jgi:hypothetical protein
MFTRASYIHSTLHRETDRPHHSRKGFGEQVQEKVTPQSEKSTGDKISETATGAYDQVAGAVQPGKSPSSHPLILWMSKDLFEASHY